MRAIVLSAIALFFPVICFGASLEGAEFPDTIEVDNGEQLLLNGLGLRKATIFGVRVYAAGLYLPHKESSPGKILGNQGRRRIVMHFLREVGGSSLRDAWEKGLRKNTQVTPEIDSGLRKLNETMRDVEVGERIVIDFFENGSVSVSGIVENETIVAEKGFAVPLLSVWLGEKPPNSGLKNGLLGLG